MNLTIKDLYEANVHVGHRVARWNTKFGPYLFAHRYGISIIDLEKTLVQLEKACDVAKELGREGKKMWFVGTKPAAQSIVREKASNHGIPFCANRWLGGALTNFQTVQSSLNKYKKYLQMQEDGSMNKLPGKEAAAIRREMARMHRNFEGLLEVTHTPDVLFVIDAKKEAIAIAEAKRKDCYVICLLDTNSSPEGIDCVIPGNDDAVQSIELVSQLVTDAYAEGYRAYQDRKKQEKTLSKAQEKVVRQEIEASGQAVTLSEEAQAAIKEQEAATAEQPASDASVETHQVASAPEKEAKA